MTIFIRSTNIFSYLEFVF